MRCETCGAELSVGAWPFCGGNPAKHVGGVYGKTSAFPFEGRHITPDGKPIVIESMHRLRKIEKQYGVVLSAFSKQNIKDTDPIKDLPKYRGEDR